ncbi:MAG: hypothetical protein V1726_00090 [Methanobacteriota archaeon]
MVHGQEQEQLRIVLYDHQPDTGIPKEDNLFIEGHEYGIAIFYEHENNVGEIVATDVLVTVPWATYKTSETAPEISLVAPRFEEYRQFVITASKTGYQTAEKLIAVIKGELVVTTDRGTISEGETFQVTVKDQANRLIEDCLVYVQREGQQGDSDMTDARGTVYLSAPLIENDSEFASVLGYKDGYREGVTSIRVENTPVVTIAADLMTIIPVVLAVVVVVVAVIVVRIRKTSNQPDVPTMTEQEHLEPEIVIYEKRKLFSSNKKPRSIMKETLEIEPVATESVPRNEPKVEEIRIHGSGKAKETTILSTKKEEPVPSRRKGSTDWFEGTDEVRYKIDRLTRDAKKKEKDKWFEGTSDIQEKIDEAICKKHKKKEK